MSSILGWLVATGIGCALFAWPFFAPGASVAAIAALAFGTFSALVLIEMGSRSLDVRSFALLAALSSIDAAARALLVTGIGGFSPIFLLILCAGYIFGAKYGFLVGASSLLVSAVVTGGIGPWLPYQLFAAGWVGAFAGLFADHRGHRPSWRDIAILAVIGVIAGYGFGIAMDIWDWTYYQSAPGLGFHAGMRLSLALSHFARFYVTTSFAWDSLRAGGNALMVIVLGAPVLIVLGRLKAQMSARIDRTSLGTGSPAQGGMPSQG
ncbi:ECF transporter S component [Ferrimicrobium sp.]|uniref:ECF transporter S component n=1 Tax=Ferrimicrobium sp. TaxID=2926050 RepID=UPI00261A3224|nr:ECF transporter S component [Ferrimicrobium sp.]